ncbi:MAG: hypothetical protein ABI605_23155 [Rhizobacter sp.]
MSPQPASAPLVVMMHGYGDYDGYANHQAFIQHTVRKGSVVIYPRYQTAIATPCPGPYDSEPCLVAAVEGIRGGLALLQSEPSRVQPDLTKAAYFGHSFGGILTANMLNRWATLSLPTPRAMFLDDPHDGGETGQGEPSLDATLSGIPASALVQCHSGATGVIAEPGKSISSCNAIFPKLGHMPPENKNLVMTYDDAHGQPALSSGHGVCDATSAALQNIDAYDWNFCWKTFDAMRSCAFEGTDCESGVGDTPQHRSNGIWSDGTPVHALKIQKQAPILP